MKDITIIAVVAIVIAGLLCATHLAMNDHPWMAFLILLTISGTSFSSKACDRKDATEHERDTAA